MLLSLEDFLDFLVGSVYELGELIFAEDCLNVLVSWARTRPVGFRVIFDPLKREALVIIIVEAIEDMWSILWQFLVFLKQVGEWSMFDYFRCELLPPTLLCLPLHLILIDYLLLNIPVLSHFIHNYPNRIPLGALVAWSGALEGGVLEVLDLDARPSRSIAILHQYN